MRLDLYNNINTKDILEAINIEYESIPRERGVGIDKYEGKKVILIHTRTGGGNREYYEDENSLLQKNKYYIDDEDDSFDSTYANFYFRIPKGSKIEKYYDKQMKDDLGDTEKVIKKIFNRGEI